MKKLSQVIALAGVMSAGLVGVQAVQAEVSASAAVANNYIFRGLLMGSGTPAVSGALDYSHESGAYAGVWGGSGDTAAGDEYNVYVGFGGESGDFTYDVNYLSYLYPTGTASTLGELAEVTVGLGYKDFGLTVTAPVNDSTDVFGNSYVYTKASYSFGKFGVLVGNNTAETQDAGEFAFDYTHVNVSYAYTDNVTFSASQIVDGDAELNNYTEELLLQVSYSLPIEL